MIITTYGDRKKLTIMFLFQLLSGMLSLQFAYIISSFIAIATNKNTLELTKTLIFGILGFILFGLINYLDQYFQLLFVKDINQRIKKRVFNYYLKEESNQTSKAFSLLTNDMKQLESNGIKAEIGIISNLTTFGFALIGSLTYDYLTTIVFIICAFFPYTVSLLTKQSITLAGKNWTLQNARYTKAIKELLSAVSTITHTMLNPMLKNKLRLKLTN